MNVRRRSASLGVVLALIALALVPAAQAANPLRIGYSDWPGWVAWQVAIEKGWFTEAGVAVQFEWFDYSASMDAFAAGKIDGDFVTNGDALVMGSNGVRNVMVMLTDYSNGNDMIVAKPGIASLKDLKGKKIGIEIGLVEHLLLLDGLKKAGLAAEDVTLVNSKTNETPQVLSSGKVEAVGAWQPNAGQAMRAVPGAHPVYTSAQAPGLIYDVLAVSPASLIAHRADYGKLLKVWDRVCAYIANPATQDDAVRIMAARVGIAPQQYKALLNGTHLINVAEAKRVLQKGDGLDSLYGSSKNADAFNVRAGVYAKPHNLEGFIDPSLTTAQP